MALSKKYELTIDYTNDRVLNDELFIQHFPALQEIFRERIIVNDAYFNVSKINGNKDELRFTVSCYKDSSKGLLLFNKSYNFIPDLNSEITPNFYTQIYNYLKTLPEFSDAVDC